MGRNRTGKRAQPRGQDELTRLRQQLADVEAELDALRTYERSRAESAMRSLLSDLATLLDHFGLSLKAVQPAELRECAETLDAENERRARELLVDLHEQLLELLRFRGVEPCIPEPGGPLDLNLFDIAGYRDDTSQQPLTILEVHHPAYLRSDGTLVRKGAAVVYRHPAT